MNERTEQGRKEELGRQFFEDIANGNSREDLIETMHRFRSLMMLYDGGIREVRTKIEILNEEFKVKSSHNPIENIQSRVKEPLSIYEKMLRKGVPITLESMKKSLDDIAGLRIICAFIDDIYTVSDMLLKQDDIRLISIKDYIHNPKENGYRSLHLVVEVPVFLSDRKQPVRVEVQIRTIAMDFWASLEHQIHYKQFDGTETEVIQELKTCADTIFATDIEMQNIQKKLAGMKQNEMKHDEV